ncbi:hypothetical protein ACI3PL_29505, partial [Lacticaseibacillus paracasei]
MPRRPSNRKTADEIQRAVFAHRHDNASADDLFDLRQAARAQHINGIAHAEPHVRVSCDASPNGAH